MLIIIEAMFDYISYNIKPDKAKWKFFFYLFMMLFSIGLFSAALFYIQSSKAIGVFIFILASVIMFKVFDYMASGD